MPMSQSILEQPYELKGDDDLEDQNTSPFGSQNNSVILNNPDLDNGEMDSSQYLETDIDQATEEKFVGCVIERSSMSTLQKETIRRSIAKIDN